MKKTSGKHVLVVDDDSQLREVLKALLALDDHTVVEANNGAEALGLFKPGRFDLVITDLKMPHVPGNVLARRIKELAPQQPILMLTAYAWRSHLGNPVDVVIRKPFGFDDFRKTLAGLLSASAETNVN